MINRYFRPIVRWLADTYRMSYRPDPNIPFYLNKKRRSETFVVMFLMHLVLVLGWHYLYPASPTPWVLIGSIALANLLCFLFILFPKHGIASPLAITMHAVWLNFPFQALMLYFWNASYDDCGVEMVTIAFLLYIHSSNWRGEVMGIVLSVPIAAGVFYLTTGLTPPCPSWGELVLILIACVVGVASADARLRKYREFDQFFDKTLALTKQNLLPKVEVQRNIIDAMQFNAKHVAQMEPSKRKLMLDQIRHLHALSADLELKLEALDEGHQLARKNLGRIQQFSIRKLVLLAVNDLTVGFPFRKAEINRAIELQMEEAFRVEGHAADLGVALAKVLFSMLQSIMTAAKLSDQTVHLRKPYLRISTAEQISGGCLTIESLYPCQIQQGAFEREAAVLPAFSAQTLPLYGITWEVTAVRADGTPDVLKLYFPSPNFYASSLMGMLETQA